MGAKTTLQNPKGPISGAEAVVRSLVAEGVDLIYGYPGGAIMPVYDELYKFQDHINHVLVRHEQGAAHAAQGFARVSGQVGVCMATSGPGATNLVTGIADAMIDSTPLVCITGQVPSHLLGSDAFQETDIIGISTPVTKWSYQITRVEEIPEIIAKAFYIARSGRPGPVLVDITKDAQFGTSDFSYTPCIKIRSYKPVPETKENDLAQAAKLINAAKNPLIVWGQGVILGEAEEEWRQAAARIMSRQEDRNFDKLTNAVDHDSSLEKETNAAYDYVGSQSTIVTQSAIRPMENAEGESDNTVKGYQAR